MPKEHRDFYKAKKNDKRYTRGLQSWQFGLKDRGRNSLKSQQFPSIFDFVVSLHYAFVTANGPW